MTERWLVSVGAGRWQMSGILAAKGAGLKVLALDGSADAPGLAIADRAATVDIRDPAASLECVRATEIRPAGAASFVTDAGMMTAAAIREAFGLPGPDSVLAQRLTDKCRQRRIWSDKELPCPAWSEISAADEAEKAIEAIRGKMIVKPADSAGSRGLHVFNYGDDWMAGVDAAIAASRSRRAILESFVEGAEFAVETFSARGATHVLAVSEKKKVPGTNNTVAVELASSALDPNSVAEIGSLAARALAALGYADGPGHTEILRDANGKLWLVETAGRGGGFMVADGIVPRSSCFDLAEATALQAVGLAPAEPDRSRRAFVLRFIPSRKGKVIRVAGVDAANAIAGVQCEALVKVGDRVEMAMTDGARMAYILSWAESRADAFARADRAESCLDIAIASD